MVPRTGDVPEPATSLVAVSLILRVFNRQLTVQEAKVVSLWPTLMRARTKPPTELTEDEKSALRLYYLSVLDDEYRQLLTHNQALDEEWRDIRPSRWRHPRDAGTRRLRAEAHVLYRGMYDQPRERVVAGTPAVLPPMAESLPRNRLGLATCLSTRRIR